jgi:hypothetical protein
MTLAPAKFTASRRSQISAIGPSSAMTGPAPWLRSPELSPGQKRLVEKFALDLSLMRNNKHHLAQWPHAGVRSTCATCKAVFFLTDDQRWQVAKGETSGSLFCGMQCQNAWHRKTFNAEIGRRGAAKIGATKRRKAEEEGRVSGYRKVNNRHEHRTVAEQKLGRALLPGEIVHHKDDDKRNNHPNNLRVFSSQAEHARYHMGLYWKKRHAQS